MNDFGGLEEFAKNLATEVHKKGHDVSFLSTTWVSPDNQYLLGLRENNIPVVQPQKWLSDLLSDWKTKQKILSVLLWISVPLIFILGSMRFAVKGGSWKSSYKSAFNWMRGQITKRIIEPDRRKPIIRLMLNRWKNKWQPDLIHIQGYTSDLLFVIDWAYSKKIPVVYEEHQTPDAQFDWWKDFKTSINKASTVVAVSQKSAEALREVCGVSIPIVVAYYMVPDPYASGWIPDSPSKNDELTIMTGARLYVTKGLTYLLEAIVKVRQIYPKTQFKVYGDGPLRDELLAYAEKLGLDGTQIFVGTYTSRNELSKIMAQTDMFVMSSILEGLPIAMLEAMSFGRPLVVTTAGGIPEAIQNEKNGLLCEPRDPDCLATNICRLIADPHLRQVLGAEARKSYETGPYHPSAVGDNYILIYQNTLSQYKR